MRFVRGQILVSFLRNSGGLRNFDSDSRRSKEGGQYLSLVTAKHEGGVCLDISFVACEADTHDSQRIIRTTCTCMCTVVYVCVYECCVERREMGGKREGVEGKDASRPGDIVHHGEPYSR